MRGSELPTFENKFLEICPKSLEILSRVLDLPLVTTKQLFLLLKSNERNLNYVIVLDPIGLKFLIFGSTFQ